MRRQIAAAALLLVAVGNAWGGVHYTVTDLGTLPGTWSSFATGINNNGQVVGLSSTDQYGTYFDCILALIRCKYFGNKPFRGVVQGKEQPMERRFELRLEELLEDAVLDPRIPEGMLDRLERFVKPYAAIMESPAQQQHLWEYVAGLFSDVKRKNAETIAYFHDQDRQALQKFIGQSLWDDGLLIEELSRQVGAGSWASPMACSFSIPRPSENKARTRWASHGSGVAVTERSTTARWAFISVTFRERSTPWWTCGCICNKDWAKDKPRRKKCGVPG